MTAYSLYGLGPIVRPELGIKSGSGDPGAGLNVNRCRSDVKKIKSSERARLSPRQARRPGKRRNFF